MDKSDWVATLLGIAGVLAGVAALFPDRSGSAGARPPRAATAALCLGLVGAAVFVALLPAPGPGPSPVTPGPGPSAPTAAPPPSTDLPPGPTEPATSTPPPTHEPPPPPPPAAGPALNISPRNLQAGATAVFAGTGFEPNTGVAFRFANTSGISWPIQQVFVAVDGNGTFQENDTFDITVCGMSGRVEAYYDSNDLVRDAGGSLPRPVAASPSVVVQC